VARLHLNIGVKLKKLRPGQAEYIGVKPKGPFKADHYRYRVHYPSFAGLDPAIHRSKKMDTRVNIKPAYDDASPGAIPGFRLAVAFYPHSGIIGGNHGKPSDRPPGRRP
jgi:hypothetical protein